LIGAGNAAIWTRQEEGRMAAKIPGAYRQFTSSHPRIGRAYEELGEALLAEGPLDRRTAELVKLGIAVGARLEGAVHAHVRRARDAGASDADVRHAVRLALITIGFPSMMSALSWAEDVLSSGARDAGAGRRSRVAEAAGRRGPGSHASRGRRSGPR
jgi:alkylhydroperoxidase/carboxymuconolactone decarboxylase family protein YurZ